MLVSFGRLDKVSTVRLLAEKEVQKSLADHGITSLEASVIDLRLGERMSLPSGTKLAHVLANNRKCCTRDAFEWLTECCRGCGADGYGLTGGSRRD